MRSHAVVIVRIVFQNPTQMLLAQDNDVVQTLAPDRSDQPFGKAVLPRRGRCNWLSVETAPLPSRRPPLQVADPKRFMASCSFRAVHVLGSLGLLSRGFEDQPCDFVGMGD